MMKQKANEADQESDLREAFKIFDRDKDGFIDLKELKTVATMLGSMLTKEEVEEFMKEADVVSPRLHAFKEPVIFNKCIQDGNGKLDYDEFVKMMLQY